MTVMTQSLKEFGIKALISWGHMTSSVTWPFDSRWATWVVYCDHASILQFDSSVQYSSVTIACMKLQSHWEITFSATRSRTLALGYRRSRYGRPTTATAGILVFNPFMSTIP